jgi:hypothetical protein
MVLESIYGGLDRAPDVGCRITDHVVQIRLGRSGWTAVTAGTSARPNAVIGKLVNGRTYQVRVAARTEIGRGPWSRSVAVTPRAG